MFTSGVLRELELTSSTEARLPRAARKCLAESSGARRLVSQSLFVPPQRTLAVLQAWGESLPAPEEGTGHSCRQQPPPHTSPFQAASSNSYEGGLGLTCPEDGAKGEHWLWAALRGYSYNPLPKLEHVPPQPLNPTDPTHRPIIPSALHTEAM